MDGTPTEPSGSSPGARDSWALLLEIRNEQRALRHALEALLRNLGLSGSEPRPQLPQDGPTEARREARGLGIIQRALARRERAAGEVPPPDPEKIRC